MKPVHYTLGFGFTPGSGRVLLQRHGPSGPLAVRNRWNGLGGKIEPDETPVQAMRREFREEGGLDIVESRWERIVTFGGDFEEGTYRVHCFRTTFTLTEARVMNARQYERDDTELFFLDRIPKGETAMANLAWLIPLASMPYRLVGEVLEV